MNMENNNVCNGGNCCKEGGCDHGNMMMGHGCCGWRKCHMIKKIICVAIVIIAFCLGTQFGELKSMARYGNLGRGMMNWNYTDGANWKSVKVDNGSSTTQGTVPAPKQ